MNRFLLLCSACILLADFLLSGCTTTNDITNGGTGQMIGQLRLEEMDCITSASFADATVEILETNIRATSDDSGMFVLQNVPAGYYTLHYFKPGYSEFYSAYPIEFVGGGRLYLSDFPALAKTCNWTTRLTTPSFVQGGNYFNLTNPAAWTTVVDSTGKDKIAASMDRLIYYFSHKQNINYLDTSTYYGSINANELDRYPFSSTANSGDTIFIQALILPCIEMDMKYYMGDTLKTYSIARGYPSNTTWVVLP